MKAAVKAAWVKDLRENPDARGVGHLDYIDGGGRRKQCCLGRLCLLAVEAGVIPPPELGDDGIYRYLDGDGVFGEVAFLPPKVAEWAGVIIDGSAELDVLVPQPGGMGWGATDLNDRPGCTFAQIADEVEQNVPEE